MAKVINYRIIVNTKEGGSTDNDVAITMHGTSGTSDAFDLQGNLEDEHPDSFTHVNQDIGIINKITLDVNGTLSDKWSPYSIKILRGTELDEESSADGWSEFLINKELGYDPEDFRATHIVPPPIIITPEGEPVETTERIFQVQFDHNPGQASQVVMKYKETWTDIERIMISTENRTKVGLDVKITYESPETVAGKFGAEIGASWEKEVTTIEQNETQKINQREFDWSFEADPKSYVFRLQVFLVPYVDQIYKDSVGNSRAIRKLRSEIIPAHIGDFLFIPRIDDGKIDPVLMSELEQDWFKHMSKENENWIKERFLDKWLNKGWVVYDNQVPIKPIEKKAVVVTDAVNIRENHDPNARIIGHLKELDQITVLETWTQGTNIWAKLKPNAQQSPETQWAAMMIGKIRYIKFLDEIAVG